jgi:hypothetical protein
MEARMDNGKLVEMQRIPEETQRTEGDHRTSTLVELGEVSKETHGFVHGLEIGFHPKS